jgi:hypothetical protein
MPSGEEEAMMMTIRRTGCATGRGFALAALVAAGILAGAPRATASEPVEPDSQTFVITGQELTAARTIREADGSVRMLVQAGMNGLLRHVEAGRTVFAHALVRVSITVRDDELLAAEVSYAQLGHHAFSVTLEIDPCWFEYVNDRDATAYGFGADVMEKIEAQAPPGAVDPCFKAWLTQRLALLGAKTAEPYVKQGIILVPPRA